MGMKFLNKKGWHTGSLRNIENVWKAEQKHDAEQRKLEELRKQIHEEREKSEFRLLQEQAGLVPKQERLDFLYDSGLSTRKDTSDGGFKALESLPPKAEPESSASANKATPGALFEDKPQSANDAWRKLHSDPLLLIKQREQEALARVKNNPVQMAMIRKSVEAKKHKEKTADGEKHKEKHHRKKSKHSSSKHRTDSDDVEEQKTDSKHKETTDQTDHRRNSGRYQRERNHEEDRHDSRSFKRDREDRESSKRDREDRESSKRDREDRESSKRDREDRESSKRDGEDRESSKRDREDRKFRPPLPPPPHNHHRRNNTAEISKEDRAAKLKEMQMDAELHEEQRWRRLKQAEDDDAKEVTHASSSGRNFLDAAHKSIYGAEKGGSSTIEESVRRRTHYSQRKSEGNAFRR